MIAPTNYICEFVLCQRKLVKQMNSVITEKKITRGVGMREHLQLGENE